MLLTAQLHWKYTPSYLPRFSERQQNLVSTGFGKREKVQQGKLLEIQNIFLLFLMEFFFVRKWIRLVNLGQKYESRLCTKYTEEW